jgi:flagellar biosynthesis/type III secretory pathway protein FliH
MNDAAYLERVKKKLKKKKICLFKKGILEGKQHAALLNEDLRKYVVEVCEEINNEKLDLLKDLAYRLIRETIINNDLTIIRMIKNILKQVPDCREVEISLHPDDAKVFRATNNKHLLSDIMHKIVIFEDITLLRGSIILKANKSIIDAQINTQIKRASELINAEISHGFHH